MCGIAGTAGEAPDRALLEAMADAMVHRGPDGSGIWSDAQAGLSFRRLAIIDLHERSNQPLHLQDLHLVFNGEIYNYRELRDQLAALGHYFETEGDGEVLLHAWQEWGESALDRVNGMFAFAVWDAARRRLTLATDPFGEKPLYYIRLGRRLAFASDIRALLRDPALQAAADESALAGYLAYGEMPALRASFFSGVERLPGAHVLRLADGAVEVERYWWPSPVEPPANQAEAAAGLRELLLDSVRLRLRSDVPVGTSLSGGIDSSATVMLAAQLAVEHSRHAFTARFPNFERDEWVYADEVSRAAGVACHHVVEPTAGDLLSDLPRLVRDHEEPVRSSSVYAQWSVNRIAREAGVTVLLDGQGADELLGGYRHLWGPAIRSYPWRAAAGALVRDASLVAPAAYSLWYDAMPGAAARGYRRLVKSPYVGAAALSVAGAPPADPVDGAGTPLTRALLRDAFVGTLPALLRYADRSSMAHGREVRLPFLDRRVAEYALSLPPEQVYRPGHPKWILRAAMRGVVPSSVLARRDKIGFETPQKHWFHEPSFLERFRDVLLDPAARTRHLLHLRAIEGDLAAGRWRNLDAIWRALNAELWLRELVPAA